MNAKKAIAASFGAALLAAGTGTLAHAVTGSSNTGGSATNSQSATGGSNAPSVTGASNTVTGGITANSSSLVTRSHNRGGTKIAANTKSGSNTANASNRGSAKAGGIKIHF
ncbi:MAG: hypothetical protein E6G57_06780 [Actinobacteria bacterium]|nr:MAG: hypothetical protein E6G57_06780 [Actinomycetota bacterium]